MTKRTLAALFAGLMLFSACYDDTEILNRLDNLENTEIVSLASQIEAAKASISSLEALDAEIKTTIESLQSSGSAAQEDIKALQAYDESLENKIKDLKVYVLAQDGEVMDWAEKTFCTIEKYNAIVTEIQELQTKFAGLSTELDAKIEESASGIKAWVTETLAAYSTKEEVKALEEKLNTLSTKVDALSTDVKKLLERIQSIVFVPDYSDGKATVNYSLDGKKYVYGQSSISWRIRPEDAAAKLATQKSSLALQAKYTATRSEACDVTLAISSASAEDDVLTLVFSGKELKDEFFSGEEGASVCLLISDGSNDLTSEYVGMVAVQEAGVSVPSEMTLKFGASAQIEAKVTPAGAKLKWASSDEKIVKVDNEGTVTAIAEGTATITATVVSSGKSASCKVTVLAPVKLEGIALDKKTATLMVGKTDELKVTFTPADAANKNITWTSSTPSVATVKDGIVTGVSVGEATIFAISEDGGFSASCKYTVIESEDVSVESVSLDKTEAKVKKGSWIQLTATVLPEDATNKAVKWESGDETIATVTEEGKVAGVKKGTATITVTTEDGEKTAECKVTVIEEEGEKEGDYEYVDLGLSVKWATTNIGAKDETEVGSYFSWGSTSTSQTEFTSDEYSKMDISGKYNSAQVQNYLDTDDDTAKSVCGAHWRMPTEAEWTELISNCEITYNEEKNGYLFTSKKEGYTDKTLFIPAGGYYRGTTKKGETTGYYWTANNTYGSYDYAACSYLTEQLCTTATQARCYGLPIRPVYVANPIVSD